MSKKIVSCLPLAKETPIAPQVLADDVYHLANDAYQKKLTDIEQEILAYCDNVEPHIVQIARYIFEGKSISETARIVKRRKQVVNNAAHSVQVKTLVGYLQHKQLFEAGADESHIKHKLWCIAVDNEKIDAPTAIKALQEMNRMRAPAGSGVSNQPLQIVINNAVLPRGDLDG